MCVSGCRRQECARAKARVQDQQEPSESTDTGVIVMNGHDVVLREHQGCGTTKQYGSTSIFYLFLFCYSVTAHANAYHIIMVF